MGCEEHQEAWEKRHSPHLIIWQKLRSKCISEEGHEPAQLPGVGWEGRSFSRRTCFMDMIYFFLCKAVENTLNWQKDNITCEILHFGNHVLSFSKCTSLRQFGNSRGTSFSCSPPMAGGPEVSFPLPKIPLMMGWSCPAPWNVVLQQCVLGLPSASGQPTLISRLCCGSQLVVEVEIFCMFEVFITL